jgi:hypothetical protein
MAGWASEPHLKFIKEASKHAATVSEPMEPEQDERLQLVMQGVSIIRATAALKCSMAKVRLIRVLLSWSLQQCVSPIGCPRSCRMATIRPCGIWVEPELLAEIEYRAKSAEGKVRHPFFKGLREDL